MYYCPNCKRNHRDGTQIHEKHIHLKEVEEDKTPSKKILSCNYESLPEIAKRQISHYFLKMEWDKRKNFGKKQRMYIAEINKVILEENHDNNMLII